MLKLKSQKVRSEAASFLQNDWVPWMTLKCIITSQVPPQQIQSDFITSLLRQKSRPIWTLQQWKKYIITFLPPLSSHTFEITTFMLSSLCSQTVQALEVQDPCTLSFSVSVTITACLPTASSFQSIFMFISGICSYFCTTSQIKSPPLLKFSAKWTCELHNRYPVRWYSNQKNKFWHLD